MQKAKKGQVIQKTKNRKFAVTAFQKFTAVYFPYLSQTTSKFNPNLQDFKRVLNLIVSKRRIEPFNIFNRLSNQTNQSKCFSILAVLRRSV